MNPNAAPGTGDENNSDVKNQWSELADYPAWDERVEAEVDKTAGDTTAQNVVELMDNPLGESRPYSEPSEPERRLMVDREGVDIALRKFSKAAHEDLSPDEKIEVELSLDIFDEVGYQLDDEESGRNVYDILGDMVQKYDRLAQKALTSDRRQKYNIMAKIAYEQRDQFTDWKAIDRAKNQPKPDPQNVLDTSAIV